MVEKKQCDTCGEMVEEAKAFCPGCGNAFVEEKTRGSISEFDLSNRTVQLGQTMYNQMLSDMGLSISKAPNREAAYVEPLATDATAGTGPGASIESDPAAVRGGSRAKSTKKIIVIALIGAVALILLLIVAIALLVAVWYFR